MNILEVENLTKVYGTQRKAKKEPGTAALKNVSFCLEKGEKLGIIGPSGCGKTTLLKLITGLIKPTSGSVVKNVSIGFVAQDPYGSLCHAMTVYNIIAEPLIYGKVHRLASRCEDEVRQAMDWVKLDYDTYADRYPHQISGGERQRVSIARALIGHPGFLALDEPTSMVDYEVKSGIMEVIRSASEAARCALLLVTHDISLAVALCDNVLVISEGEIIERAPADVIMTNPVHKNTRRLVLAGTDLNSYWAQKEKEVSTDAAYGDEQILA